MSNMPLHDKDSGAKPAKLCTIRKVTGFSLLIAGVLSAAICYYILFFTQTPIPGDMPLTYNPAPQKKDFKITVFGDWMLASGPLDKIAEKADKDGSVFAVCLGDFVKHAKIPLMKLAVESFQKKFKVPVYATPGNHDIYTPEDAAAFSTVWGNVNNCFAYGDTLFILLESAKKHISKAQLNFLDTLLKNERSKYRRCVVFSHVPPKTIPRFDKPKYRQPESSAAELQKIFDRYNVDLMVCGHAHHEMDIPFGKTRLLVIPPCGQGSRNRKNPQFGSLQLHFASDGSIEPEFVYHGSEFSNRSFDEFVYYRLNQRSIFFCFALLMIVSGVVLIILPPKQ